MTSPILVTACQRGGNTWVARMLACAPSTRFLYQPFNGDAPRPITSLRWPYLERKFTYVHGGNEDRFIGPTRNLLYPRIPLEFPALEAYRTLRARSLGPTRRRFREDLLPLFHARWGHHRPVIAGPGGVFLVEWFRERMDGTVVCLERHPAGIAAGYKRMGWTRDMGDVLDQEALITDLLWEHRDALVEWNRRHKAGRADWLGQAILWWKLTAAAFHRYKRRRSDVLFRRYEDMATDPLAAFEDLYGATGLPWNSSARARVMEHTGASSSDLGDTLHVLRRDSRATASSWRTRLDPEEIAEVQRQAAPWVERYELSVHFG